MRIAFGATLVLLLLLPPASNAQGQQFVAFLQGPLACSLDTVSQPQAIPQRDGTVLSFQPFTLRHSCAAPVEGWAADGVFRADLHWFRQSLHGDYFVQLSSAVGSGEIGSAGFALSYVQDTIVVSGGNGMGTLRITLNLAASSTSSPAVPQFVQSLRVDRIAFGFNPSFFLNEPGTLIAEYPFTFDTPLTIRWQVSGGFNGRLQFRGGEGASGSFNLTASIVSVEVFGATGGVVPGAHVVSSTGIPYPGAVAPSPPPPDLCVVPGGGAPVLEQITRFPPCGPSTTGILTPRWGRFGPKRILEADSREKLELECVAASVPWYGLFYTPPGGTRVRVGVCPFVEGCNEASFFHSGDSNSDNRPDCFIRTLWKSRDYGENDIPNPWTNEQQENPEVLDWAVSRFDVAQSSLTKLDYKFTYAVEPPLPPGTCRNLNLRRPEGDLVQAIGVDPQLGPETEAFFDAVVQRLQQLPAASPMEESTSASCDLNQDGRCDIADFRFFRRAFGKCVGETGYHPAADADGDECITPTDQQYLFNPQFLVIDEDSIDNGIAAIEGISFGAPFCGGPSVGPGNPAVCVNDDIANPGVRELLFTRLNEVTPLTGLVLPTGQIGDEGLFRFSNPDPQQSLQNGATFTAPEFFIATGAAADENNLDKVDGVVPLSEADILDLEGKTVCAVVYDSDVSVTSVEPASASLKGATLGVTAFKVTAVTPNPAGSSYLPLITVDLVASNTVASICRSATP